MVRDLHGWREFDLDRDADPRRKSSRLAKDDD
jgi:hypothetical protein